MKATVDYFPVGKRFAIALVDDTDLGVLPAVEPVYRCLTDHGVRLTKTVWTLKAVSLSGHLKPNIEADTLQEAPYRKWCEALQAQGHEIGMHTASAGNNVRARTIEAYERFEEIFGHPPRTNIMHSRNRENIYWGKYLAPGGITKLAVSAFEPQEFEGHKRDSPFYWGDLCAAHDTYVRMFETLSLDTLSFDPATPFHDPRKPDVPWWFSATYGRRLPRLLSKQNLDRLRRRGSASVIHMYAQQLASGQGGRWDLAPGVREMARRLAGYADGWYVPVVTLFDRMRAVRKLAVERQGERIRLHNRSEIPITSVALRAPPGLRLLDGAGADLSLRRNALGQIPVGNLGARRVLEFVCPCGSIEIPEQRTPNYARLLAETAVRVGYMYWNGRRTGPWTTFWQR